MKSRMYSLVISLTVASSVVMSVSAQTVPATNVTSGTFGGSTGGNYSFPAYLGIGTSSPSKPLHVVGLANSPVAYIGISMPMVTGDTLVVGTGVSVQRWGSAPNMTFTTARDVEGSPDAVAPGDETGRFLFRGYDGGAPVSSARVGAIVDGTVTTGVVPQAITFKTGTSGSPAERMRVTSTGYVGIGTAAPLEALHVIGNVKVSGSIEGGTVIGAVYQDIAEWVPATTDLTPGTVVVLNQDRTNEVMASHTSYDSSVAGVVSAQPGVILGVAGEGKEQIATTGRVKVRVDARTSPIRVGDLLVTSDIAGTAMKSQPMDFNGRKMHQPGTLIGKALEPLAGGVGEILVLLSLQ